MTHLLAVSTGITANGVDLTRTDLRIVMRVTRGRFGGLEVRGRDTTIPSLPGQIWRSRISHQRLIEAEGFVMGIGATADAERDDFVATMRVLETLMNPEQDPYILEHTDEDGAVVALFARPVDLDLRSDVLPSYRDISCTWLAIGDAVGLQDGPVWKGGGS